MAQKCCETPVIEETTMVQPKPKKFDKKKWGDPPHEELFGTIIGATVWNIILEALFQNQWWALIPSVVLGISVFVNLIKFLSDKEGRATYPYHTTMDDFVGIIIGTAVVNVIFRVGLGNQWWGQIPSSVMIIVTIKTGYEYFMTEKRHKREQLQHGIDYTATEVSNDDDFQPGYTPSSNAQIPIEQEIIFEAKKKKEKKEKREKKAKSPEIKFCPICGIEKEDEALFCSACGDKF